ncbi:MAG: hypothetical protein ABJL11_17665 [Parasphingorhabdus sp.]
MESHSLETRSTPPFGQTRWLSFRMHPVNWITIVVGITVGITVTVH